MIGFLTAKTEETNGKGYLMRTNIKHSIFDLLFWIIGLLISLMGFIVLLTDNTNTVRYVCGIVIYGTLLLISIIMLLHSIKNVQWFDISDGYLTVYCPFGIVRQVGLNEIKKAFKANAVIYGIKMLSVRRPYIVLCIKKSVTKGCVNEAYNRKKNPYIAIPYSIETEAFICEEYKKISDKELILN
ncbi:MAG: hypothetical protein E7453_09405 [Ruminococcaceae bacterium]|nr:hypothetical protein [Oscillospiraceae bacterium]